MNTTRTHIPARKGKGEGKREKGKGEPVRKCTDSPFRIIFLLRCAASRERERKNRQREKGERERESPVQASILIVNMYVCINNSRREEEEEEERVAAVLVM